jgi:zinc protease
MDYPPATATVQTLPNGLTVILDPDPAAPVVSAQWWVETGSIHEDRLLGSGISHFLEHMVFKGTRDFSGDELADVVQAAGGHWNAYTSFDRTVYYIDGPSDSLSLFLKCLAGMVFFPILPESEFAKEQDVIRREIDMGLDDPDQAAMRLMFSGTFQIDPRRHPVIGHRHRFDALTHADLTGYHRARYTTDRSFVVVSGDFDPAAVWETITDLTKDCLPGAGSEPWVAKDPPQLGPRQVRDTFALPHSRVAVTWKLPALDDPRTPAFEVLAALLGQGKSSRLYRHLREGRHLALEISSFAWNFAEREGLLCVSADCETTHRDELVTAVCEQVAAVATSDLSDELAKVKRIIAATQFRSLTTASGRASDLASNWHEARDLDHTRAHVAAIMAVTEDDIRSAARSLTERTRTVSLLDPLDTEPPVRTMKNGRSAGGVETHTLSNGLTVALFTDSRVPLVHMQAAARAGLPSETSVLSGLNQLLASSLTKGTATRDGERIATTLESLGASASASAGNNALLVQAAGLAPDFATIADVWTEIIARPAFSEQVLERERTSQTAAWRESLTEPLHVGFLELRKNLFGSSGYGLDLLGNGESIAAIRRDDVVRHHARHCQPANMAVAVCGDIDPPAVLDALESGLSMLPSGDRWSPAAQKVSTGKETRSLLPKKQAILCIGFPGAGAMDDDRHALSMLHEYAADMAGPLFTRIREELGLAYQVGATQFHGFETGMFTFYLSTAPDQLDLAREEMTKEIAAIASGGIPDVAFDRVRATVLSGLALRQQSPGHIARQMAIDVLFGLPADHHRSMPGIIRALTPQHVREVAEKLFSGPPSVALVLPDASLA